MKKKPVKAATRRTAKHVAKTNLSAAANDTFSIAGIGASAGGVEASSQLLKHLPPNLGMAYVFIHHLSPDFGSNLTEILQRKTLMPVVKVRDDTRVEADHVYVIPPNTFMRLEGRQLRLEARSGLDFPYHPVDYFFMSLSAACRHHAIGIILSGTATDGTLGLQAIKDKGGITFAQDESAMHNEMSDNAQRSGNVDFVLSPEGIAKELSSLVGHPYVATAETNESEMDDAEIRKILNVILQKKGVDFFSHYKRTTVYRRIMRRMAVHKLVLLTDYSRKLRTDLQEVDALYQDFLINVTSFFREPGFFQALSKIVFPQLAKGRSQIDPIRIWVAGCATGEEAYSMAICLSEFLHQKRLSYPINIFATDLNERAIEKARLGIYPKSLVQHISAKRLKTFFTKIDGHYQVVKSIRETCFFSHHDLLKDPPFSRMDLISCQNVLIYLSAEPQKMILQNFHYALKASGFLLIGKSEGIGSAQDLFRPTEKDSGLFTRKAVRLPRLEFGLRNPPVAPAGLSDEIVRRTQFDVEKESDKILLSRHVPASVLVNKDLDIMRFRGSTPAYLEPASGKASLNLLKMVKDELLFDLRSALKEAKQSGLVATKEHINIGHEPNGRAVSIEVAPIRSGKNIYFLVIFKERHEKQTGAISEQRTAAGDKSVKIKKLEQALVNAREQIKTTTEDFEGIREELQSANEEILSSNEELQSINEELETSKEELQSSNEELTTINEELQNRNLELKMARDYAEAIIETIRGPLMVLNSEMRIRTANRAFYNFFKLSRAETEGCYLYELAERKWDVPPLRHHLQELLPKKIDFKDFEINHTFPGIGNRTMIVNAHKLVSEGDNKETLILVSFEDVSRYKVAEKSLLEIQEQLQLALIGGSVGTWSWNIRTNEIYLSKEGIALYGLNNGTFRSYREWEKVVYPPDLPSIRRAFKRSIERKTALDLEFRILRPDKSVRWILAKANTYYDMEGKPERIVGVQIDITERRTAQEALEESEKRFHTMSDNAPVMIWMAGTDKQCTFLNKTWLSFTGKTLEEECGKGWISGIHPDDLKAFLDVYHASFEAQREFKIDYRHRRHDGEYRWIMNHGVPRHTGDKTFIGFIGTCIDITDRIDLERQKDDFMGIASHELKTPVTSIKAYAQILQEKFRKANDGISVNMLTRLDLQIDKLTGLINTLLDVARLQSGQMDYEQTSFELGEFVQEVAEELQRTSIDHIIVTEIKATGHLYADRERISQVLTNLISNAVKYSPPSTSVTIRTEHIANDFIISVHDFGVGIPKEMQEKIFGRFFRVSESAGNRVSGLGLGLFISSEIVKQHGGKLWLESEPGKGSKFFFSLPDKSKSM